MRLITLPPILILMCDRLTCPIVPMLRNRIQLSSVENPVSRLCREKALSRKLSRMQLWLSRSEIEKIEEITFAKLSQRSPSSWLSRCFRGAFAIWYFCFREHEINQFKPIFKKDVWYGGTDSAGCSCSAQVFPHLPSVIQCPTSPGFNMFQTC